MEQESKQNRSIGEKIFDWGTYAGIAGVGTFILTIPLAYWSKYTGGAKWYDKTAKLLKDKGAPEWLSNSLLGATITMWGGNAMIAPVAVAEHYKVPIVKKLNAMFGDRSDPASIEEAPKQTLMALVGGRILAWCTVFTGFVSMSRVFPKSFDTFENEFGTRLCQLFKKPTHVLGEETRAFRFGKMAALDVFATAAATTLLYIGSHMLTNNKAAKAKRTLSDAPALSTPTQPAEDTPVADHGKPGTTVSHADRAAEMLALSPKIVGPQHA